MILELHPDGVDRIGRVINPVGDRRDPKHRQKKFPEIPGDEDETPRPETPAPVDEDRRPAEDDDDHTVDLLVLGLLLPTRQSLPSFDRPSRLH
jgi:hypothetical protein